MEEKVEFLQFSAKTVEDAITEACEQLMVTSEELEYEVVSEGSSGFLGIAVKPATIRARVRGTDAVITHVENEKPADREDGEKTSVREERPARRAPRENHTEVKEEIPEEKGEPSNVDGEAVITRAKAFLNDVFAAMQLPVNMEASYNNVGDTLSIDLQGDDMGVLIGKRGQTLDSLQYLVSLVVNREEESYIHVKLDTEGYRDRRKETLEILARNIAYKVRKSRSSVSLEPMNPYERRIIHAALQNDRFVTTHSEGEDPYRRVVVTLK
ncbi:MAG: protein jag [Lachnospiraceae bacterium]|nr:protein jag [Lachnospiraceae bacterium]